MRRWATLSVLVIGMLMPAAAAAKSATAGQGITVSPAILQLTLGATQPQTSYDLSLTNHTPATQSLHLSFVDFGTLDETGGLFLIGQPNDFERKYGLAAWMSISQPVVSIEPGQTVVEKVAIINQRSLISGGHYGAVVVTTDADQPSGDQARVDLTPIITQLLFLNKTGGDIFSLKLAGIQKPGGLTGLPSKVQLRFQDTGNVHVVPRGLVTIIDPAGREVSRGIINEDSDIILPGTVRQIEVAMRAERTVAVPGRYQLVVDYRYDGQDGYTRAAYPFYFINGPLLIGWLLGLLVAVGLIVAAIKKIRHLHRSGRLRELGAQTSHQLRSRATSLRRRNRR